MSDPHVHIELKKAFACALTKKFGRLTFVLEGGEEVLLGKNDLSRDVPDADIKDADWLLSSLNSATKKPHDDVQLQRTIEELTKTYVLKKHMRFHLKD